MYIRNKVMNKGKNRYYVIEDRIKVGKKLVTKNIRYLGTAKKLLEDLEKLDELKKSLT